MSIMVHKLIVQEGEGKVKVDPVYAILYPNISWHFGRFDEYTGKLYELDGTVPMVAPLNVWKTKLMVVKA